MTLPLMYPIWFLLVFAFIWLLTQFFRAPRARAVAYEPALESAKLMKDWGSWMTTVSTAVIGANGFLVASTQPAGSVGIVRDPLWSFLSVLFFGLSITFAAWVIGSLPSIVSRLKRSAASRLNDIYEMNFFAWLPVRLAAIAGLQHFFFVLGMYCFALYIVGACRTICLFC